MTKRPPIIVSTTDYEAIERLLERNPAPDLEAELERADIVDPESLPEGVVAMNSVVHFTVSGSGETFRRKLVFPGSAGGEETVSILAPVGSALLGLTEGDTIEWPTPGGRTRTVRIERVEASPDA